MNIIYTKPTCPYCVQAKNLMSAHNLTYTEMVIGEDLRREEFIELFPKQKTVPLIVLNGRVVGGYTDLAIELGSPARKEPNMNESAQKQALRDLLEKNIVTVNFTKRDGTNRIMEATLNSDHIPGDIGVSNNNEAPDIIHVYDVEADGWRTIRLDSIITITTQKV